MKYLIITLTIISSFLLGFTSHAQDSPDTALHVTMEPVKISAEREWANDTARYRYNQTKYYITTILPYLNEVVAQHEEMQRRILQEDEWSKKKKKKYLKAKEDELRQKFESEIKGLNETQGVLLVKLISRQTGENLYHLLLDYKSRLTATKWLGWAAFNGFNLNKQYNPEDEAMIESIMENLDYPLPSFYYKDQILTVN